MSEDKSLPSQLEIPKLLAGIVSAFVLTPIAFFVYPHLTGHAIPESLSGLIPEIAATFSAGLIVVAGYLIHRHSTRGLRETPKAKGDRLAVYVALFGEDPKSIDARNDVIESIRDSFSTDYVEILPAGVRYKLTQGVNDENATLKATTSARKLLAEKGGQILIWGFVRKENLDTFIELRFVTADPTSDKNASPGTRRVYSKKGLVLDSSFGPAMGSVLAAQIAVIAGSADKVEAISGTYQRQILQPIAERLRIIAENPIALAAVPDKVTLLIQYGAIQYQISEETCEVSRLQSAAKAFSAALALIDRKEEPWRWANAQCNFGMTVKNLGSMLPDSALLLKAIDAFGLALQELTIETYPLDWSDAQTNLGNALSALGQANDRRDPELLTQAIAAYEEAIRMRPRDTMASDWAMIRVDMGDALQARARLETDRDLRISLLREAETAARDALTVYKAKDLPVYLPRVQFNLGVALADHAELEPGGQRLEEARQVLQAAFDAFKPSAAYNANLTRVELDRVNRLRSR